MGPTLFSVLIAYILLNKNIEVEISSGRVTGSVARTTPNGKIFYAFKGIRYAEKPERFEAAIPAKPWQGSYNALEDKAMCMQGMPIPGNQSEDCLFLSVFTPKAPVESQYNKLPVMFWIYGGGFTTGDSGYNTFTPDYFLEENVIVVSVNYRVASFGFLSSGDERVPGNNGIKDVILSLQWVQANIHKFGGDPKKVTIFGQSAGAAMASYLTISPLTQGKGYFQRAIFASGSALSPWAIQRNPRKAFDSLLNITGCETFKDQLKCLQRVSTVELMSAQAVIYGGHTNFLANALNGMTFAPVIEKHSSTAAIVQGSYEILTNGDVPHIPYMTGITSEEGLANDMYYPLLESFFQRASNNLSLIVPEDMYASHEDMEVHLGPKLNEYYFNNSVGDSEGGHITKYVSGALYNKPFRHLLTLTKNQAPSYCYVFAHVGNPSIDHFSRTGIDGVGHAEDLGYLFKDFRHASLTAEDLKIKEKIVRTWANFAKTGDPNSEDDPILDGVVWPQIFEEADKVRCLQYGATLEIVENPREEEYEMWRRLYEDYGHPKDGY